MPAKKTSKKPSFEQNLDALEKLVTTMEQGDLSLEKSLQHFEQGIALTRACQSALQTAEQKVSLLMEAQEQQKLVDFPSGEEQ